MPLAQYGQTSPAGLDPWPIESTLAPLATAGSSANAQMMLSDYQYQREAANNLYGQDMQQQHDFAREQLASQMQQAYMKEFPNIIKEPGGAAFLAQGGMPGMNFGGAPGAMTNLASAADMAQASKNFQASGTGYNQFAQGGAQTNLAQVPGMAGVGATVTAPALVRAAEIRAAAQRAGQGAGKPLTASVSGPLPLTGEGDPLQVSIGKVPLDQIETTGKRLEDIAQRRRDARGGVTSLQPPPGSVAQPDTGATTQPSGPVRLDTNSPAGRKAQGDAMKTVDTWSRSNSPGLKNAAADVQGAMQGTVIQTYTVNGKPVMRGKSGAAYPLGS
jgi:hypothetical protein